MLGDPNQKDFNSYFKVGDFVSFNRVAGILTGLKYPVHPDKIIKVVDRSDHTPTTNHMQLVKTEFYGYIHGSWLDHAEYVNNWKEITTYGK